MSRTRNFLYNTLTSASYQVIATIAGFIAPRVIMKYYGSEINGLILSITQFIAYFGQVEMGLSGAIIYALYKPLADRNHKAINGVVSAARKYYAQVGYVFLALTVGLALVYPLLIRTSSITPLHVGLLVLIIGVDQALEFFLLAKYRSLLTAEQKTYVIAIATSIQVVINTAIIVALASLKVDYALVRLIALTAIFLRTFILTIYVKRNYRYIDYSEKPNTAALDKRWDAFYLQILGVIYAGAPIVILTLVTKDLKLVSVYTVFNLIINGIGGILGIIVNGLYASFGDVIARGEQKTLQKAYKEFEFLYYSFITVVYAIVFVTIMPFVRIYTRGINDVNYDLPVLGFLFALNGFLNSIKNPQNMLVISAGLYKETRTQSIIQGSIIIVAGVLLTYWYGVTGVLVALMLSNIYRGIDLLFFIPKNVTRLTVRETAVRWLRACLYVILIGTGFSFVNYNVSSYTTWIFLAVCVGISSMLVVLLGGFAFDRQDMAGIWSRIASFRTRWKHSTAQ